VTPALRQILPKFDIFKQPKPVTYKSCAIVGNSGLNLYHRLGKELSPPAPAHIILPSRMHVPKASIAAANEGDEIDGHDAVIRFNSAPTQVLSRKCSVSAITPPETKVDCAPGFYRASKSSWGPKPL